MPAWHAAPHHCSKLRSSLGRASMRLNASYAGGLNPQFLCCMACQVLACANRCWTPAPVPHPFRLQLGIDERVSCLGGLTDDLARALAKRCRALQELHVAFDPHSLSAELFTDMVRRH